ncbi:DNA translocase FtsK [Gracilibacillus kekensis]|uniref:DNA segregation ATPase FtsK/SpoIIIE, S-DNA-T family n=1 Tax=Gracilibacillus kekensis TaxID=1027249 RepID=A0A1M7NLJ4_9BACI|nr:DNA translocase FtsK [Gracilibacillus kekensis]SHN04599.1 DNA segregation ATPase FtsK/SpoIIIE, S-DNA-T family [Gracilibacillus kekensis]
MWKNLKKRWEHLFDDNEQENPKNPTTNTMYKSIETKMAYQYPKNNLNKRLTRKPIHNKERKKPEDTVDSNLEQIHHQQPFKAQEVPSPVYGFRSNQKKQQEPSNEEIDPSAEEVTDNTHLTESIDRNCNSMETANEETLNYDLKNQQKPTNNRVEVSNSIESRKERKKAINRNTSKPLNVIMTPRDKWRQQRKRQEVAINGNQNEDKEESTFDTVQKNEQKINQRHESTSFNHAEVKKTVPIHLLNDALPSVNNHREWVDQQAETLQTTLRYFNIKASVVDATQGPSVTRFEIQPEPGVKVSKIKNLSDDIKLNLAAKDIRMEAPIPGKSTIGIEVPNLHSEPVFLQKLLESDVFSGNTSPLTVALGADIEGESVVTDLKQMPHGLIAGATGSGKSVCINTILISLLYKANHEEVKFLLIDPKMVELTPYNDLPHLVAPVITDVKAATSSLKWAVQEMEDRYSKFVKEGARDIGRYNEKMKQQHRYDDHMPYIVIVIDELADLMMTSPQDVEDAICRIAQKARACGIHLLIATQRPSVDVITGLIKANIPTRIAFSVSSQVDSRTILDTNGAEKLLGKGDMLFVENGSSETKRIQGAFVSDDEIERITNYVKQIAEPNYLFEQEQLIQQISSNEVADELYQEAVEFVLEYNGASASLLQRRFKVGYNRAARLIDMMEDNGIISGQNGSKQREILVSRNEVMNETNY